MLQPSTTSLLRAARYDTYKGWVIGIFLYSLPIISPLLLASFLGLAISPILDIIFTTLLWAVVITLILFGLAFLLYLYSPTVGGRGNYSAIHRNVYVFIIVSIATLYVLQIIILSLNYVYFSIHIMDWEALLTAYNTLMEHTNECTLEAAPALASLPGAITHSSNNEEFIPWNITPSIVRAQSTLHTFFEWVPEDTLFPPAKRGDRKFLDEHCVNLIKPAPLLNGMENTGIPTSFFNKANLLKKDQLVDCSNYIHNTNLPDSDKAMVYTFVNKDSERMYAPRERGAGSSINMTGRLQTYSRSWDISPQRVMVEMRNSGGFDNYHFIPSFEVPNYRNLFDSLYPEAKFEPKYRYILDRFTEYHCRIVEQAIISYAKPEINDLTSPVTFSFSNVNIDTYTPNTLDQAHPVSVYNLDNELIEKYDSINNAKRMLGVTRSSIYWSRNRTDSPVWSETLQQNVYLFDHVINEVLTKPIHAYQKLMPITGISLEDIPYGEIHAILDNKSDLPPSGAGRRCLRKFKPIWWGPWVK